MITLRDTIETTLQESITDTMYADLLEFAFEKSFEKKEYLAESGGSCKYQYFISKGACYSYYINEKGDKNAIQFATEGYWITDASSYFGGEPAVSTIETLEPTTALLLSRTNLELLCERHPLFDRFFRILLQNTLAFQHRRIAKTISEDAEHRYVEFSQRHPHFIQRIPQYLIASYLGMKPQSLSRIRKGK